MLHEFGQARRHIRRAERNRHLNRILILSPSVYQRAGHARDYVLNGLAKGAATLGSLELHVLGFDGPFVMNKPPNVTSHTLEVTGCEFTKGSTALKQIRWGLQRIARERGLVEHAIGLSHRLNCVGVLLETFEYYSLGRQISRFKCPLRSVFHDTSFNVRQTSVPAAFYKMAMALSAARIVRHCERTFVHGDAMKANLIQSLGLNSQQASRVAAIPYGAPTPNEFCHVNRSDARQSLGIATEGPLLLAFGTLRRDKSFPLLLAGVSHAPDWRVLIAGPEGDLTFEEIGRIVRQLGISDRVYCTNRFISTDEQPLFFGAADAVVGIYSSAVRHESGTCQLARAFRRPIIASGPPDLEAYVQNAGVGWALPSRTPEAVAETLFTIQATSGDQWQTINERIEQCAVERSWARICSDVFRGWY